jgi:hypothetical protein
MRNTSQWNASKQFATTTPLSFCDYQEFHKILQRLKAHEITTTTAAGVAAGKTQL